MSNEHTFERGDLQEDYRELRDAGHPPDVAAIQVLRNAYKRTKSQIDALEENAESFKQRARNISGDSDVDLPDGSFKVQTGSGRNVDSELEDEYPSIWEKFVNEYEYTYTRFY